MSDRNAMERTVAVRVAAVVVVVGLLVGMGQGVFVEDATLPMLAPDTPPAVASASSTPVRPSPDAFGPDMAEMTRPVDTF